MTAKSTLRGIIKIRENKMSDFDKNENIGEEEDFDFDELDDFVDDDEDDDFDYDEDDYSYSDDDYNDDE